MPLEPVRLDVRDEASCTVMVAEAGALLRAGVPVVVFVHAQSSTVMAFKARPVVRGFFMVAADYKKTGIFHALELLLPLALKSVEGAFENLRRDHG